MCLSRVVYFVRSVASFCLSLLFLLVASASRNSSSAHCLSLIGDIRHWLALREAPWKLVPSRKSQCAVCGNGARREAKQSSGETHDASCAAQGSERRIALAIDLAVQQESDRTDGSLDWSEGS